MKNCILKGLCLFFMLLSLMMSAFTLVTDAQSGHGGSTEVIARIEPQTEAPTAAPETQPLPDRPASSDGTPIQTGEAMAWAALLALIVSAVLIAAVRLNRRDRE